MKPMTFQLAKLVRKLINHDDVEFEEGVDKRKVKQIIYSLDVILNNLSPVSGRVIWTEHTPPIHILRQIAIDELKPRFFGINLPYAVEAKLQTIVQMKDIFDHLDMIRGWIKNKDESVIKLPNFDVTVVPAYCISPLLKHPEYRRQYLVTVTRGNENFSFFIYRS